MLKSALPRNSCRRYQLIEYLCAQLSYKNAEDSAAGIERVLKNTEKLGFRVPVKKVKENYSEAIVADIYLCTQVY
jgi:hypothetical protein